MKRLIFAAIALTVATSAAFGGTFPTWEIEDAAVPVDGTTRVHCLQLRVPAPRDCSIEVRTRFETIAPLGEEYASVAEFWVEGVRSIGVCSVAPDLVGETCLAFNQMRFEARGTYRVCLGLQAFPVHDLGGEWDDFGHGDRNTDPHSIVSDIHHSSEMTQDCGIFYEVFD